MANEVTPNSKPQKTLTKLHELLAVEGPLRTQAEKTRADLNNAFDKKRTLYSEKLVTFHPSEEGKNPVTEEQLDLKTTIGLELAWIAGIWSKALDTAYQIAEANTVARADIILDTKDGPRVLASGIPATALLELEKRAEEIRELVHNIPTLDPSKSFKLDTNRGAGIYVSREVKTTRTKKVIEPLILYPATVEHPAQVKEISVDRPVGEVVTQEWSGLITPAQKAEMMDRAEALKRAVKQARSRANGVSVDIDRKIGNVLLSFVFEG